MSLTEEGEKELAQAMFTGAEATGIESIINLLGHIQISKILGHSEQIMGRFFEDHIMKRVVQEQIQRRARGQDSIHEVFVHASSLHDCCSWCGRLWTALSGLRRLGDGTEINIRVFMSTGRNYPLNYFESPSAELKFLDSRDGEVLKTRKLSELTTFPNIIFYYGGVTSGGAGAGHSGTA